MSVTADFDSLVFEESPLNIAVAALKAQLQRATDANGTLMFSEVVEGPEQPWGSILPMQTPHCRIWREDSDRNAENEQMLVVDLLQRVNLHITVATFDGSQVQQQMERFVRAVLRKLEFSPTEVAGQSGMQPDAEYDPVNETFSIGTNRWYFPSQIVHVMNLGYIKNPSGNEAASPGWYAVKIAIQIYAENEYRTGS